MFLLSEKGFALAILLLIISRNVIQRPQSHEKL